MRVVDDAEPVVGKDEIFRLLGYKGAAVSGRLEKKVDTCIEGLKNKIRPRILYTKKKIRSINKGKLTLEGDVTLKSVKLSKAIGKCEKLTCFLVTIGREVDDSISTALRKKRFSDAYIYDAIGSAAVEASVEKFQESIDAKVSEENKSTTLRFSPGYCDWQIQEQKKIFNVLNNDLINVKLNESCLMSPRKSVSGVFGIGDSRLIDKKEANPCRLCGMHTCMARRV